MPLRWICQCGQKNAPKALYCLYCGEHYTAVDWKRDRSKSQKRKEQDPFTPPPRKEAKSKGRSQTAPALPPSPRLPPPPAPPGGVEGNAATVDIQQHLAAIRSYYGTAATSSLAKEIQTLEQRGESSPRLTHGHLSKLGKAQKQVELCKQEVQKADKDWQAFALKAKNSMQERWAVYQRDREKAKAALVEATENLSLLRTQVKHVASALRTNISVEDEGDAIPTLEEMQKMLGKIEESELIDDDEMQEDMEEELVEDKTAEPAVALRAFRRAIPRPGKAAGAASPPKGVRQTHLKQAVEKKEKGEKADVDPAETK